jgi:hypothetical protein
MAEQMPPPQVEVINPETGEPGFVPAHQLEDALSQGFTEVTPEDKLQEKYGGLGQQALTALEGAGVTGTLGASSAIERAVGVSPEDITGRREANPGAYMLGQVAGLLAPVGIGGRLAKAAGEAGAAALGFTEASIGSKIGSAATQAAIENMVVAGGDEASKMILQDPNQSVETAALNVGLAGVIGAPFGAALGAVSPLWSSMQGSKVGGVLKAITDKAGGLDSGIPDALQQALDATGIEMAPEIKAGLVDDPTIKQWFLDLQQSQQTGSAKQAQTSFKEFKKNVGNKLLEFMGRNADSIPEDFSNYEAGKAIGEVLEGEFGQNVKPIIEMFESVREKYKGQPLFVDLQKKISDDIADLVRENGWNLAQKSPQMQVIRQVLDDLPGFKTIDDLTKYQSIIGEQTSDYTNAALRNAGQKIKSVLRNAEADAVTQSLAQEAPELLATHQVAREAWSSASALRDKLDDIIKVPGSDKISSWLKDLKSFATTDGEKIWQRVGNAKNVDLLNTLQQNFPQTFEKMRDLQLDQMLSKVASKAAPDEVINPKRLLTAIEKLSPEQKSVLVPDMDKVKGLAEILNRFDSMPWNTSKTATTLDSLWQSMPGTALGIATAVIAEAPIVGALLGGLTKVLARDIPEATKLGILKFLGSEQKLSPNGFKSMVDFIQNAYEGRQAVQKAVGNVFKAGREVLPAAYKIKESDIKKLDKRVDEIKREPQSLMDVGGNVGDYMPDHSQSLAQFAGNAVGYLAKLKPEPVKMSPLDKPIEPSVEKKNDYRQALEIAQSPLIVFEKIKQGTLTSRDVVHLNSLYPGMTGQFRELLLDQVMKLDPDDAKMPYKTKVSLSLFLGQPLDSSMTPQFLQLTQGLPQAPQEQPQVGSKRRGALSKLEKVATNARTGSQAREISRAERV